MRVNRCGDVWQSKVFRSQGSDEQASRWYDWVTEMGTLIQDVSKLGHGLMRVGMTKGSCVVNHR